MKKRWVIRSLFLLPLVCVVAVWVASYFGMHQAVMRLENRDFALGAVKGLCEFGEGQTTDPSRQFIEYIFLSNKLHNWSLEPTHFGFSFSFSAPPQGFWITLPLWLPTLLLLALNWLVWRKTRAKQVGAFPVEPTTKAK